MNKVEDDGGPTPAPLPDTVSVGEELQALGFELAYIVAPEFGTGQTIVYIDPDLPVAAGKAPVLVGVDMAPGDLLADIILPGPAIGRNPLT